MSQNGTMTLEELKERYARASAETAAAGLDIATHERKKTAAQLRYNIAQRQRDELKAKISEHPDV